MAKKEIDQHAAAALAYHELPRPGKIGICLTKRADTQHDLSLAYTPGVAAPVMAIAQNPEDARRYTNKANLVAVISNGTAVLGLGNVGALASKPVMEGKAVLFKRFADIDVFDIEIDAEAADDLIETIVRISPTFGGINLEDIQAPVCFEVEQALKARLDIPVFHDDQHGTAIVVAAGLLNALELQGKKLDEISIVCAGAGAAGIASMQLLLLLGARADRLVMVDSKGVIHTGRTDLNRYKAAFAIKTEARVLADVLRGADVFIGVSGPGVLQPEMLKSMAEKPIVFALSNPDPEIDPHLAKAVRDDLIMATGRSDYPNQVNNVLAFPYIFRAALDARVRDITPAMLIAAVDAIRALAHEPVPEAVLAAYPGATSFCFGPEYILPKPVDARLRERVVGAVLAAARNVV